MASLIGSTGDITLALQSRNQLSGRTIKALSGSETTATDTKTQAIEDVKAREAANKFEALLIHNMLKSMRKTTMSENKSNDRAIYDDMLDEKLADTMIEAGGIGIADQLISQIREQQGRNISPPEQKSDTNRLRELATHIQRPAAGHSTALPHGKDTSTNGSMSNMNSLRMVTGLWSSESTSELSKKQVEFVQPLIPHARRNSQKLGTSPQAILAIAALETGWGRSVIKDKQGNDSHNLFGIKATASDNRYAETLTTEFIEGRPQKLQAKFKTYASAADAVDGFANFILSNPRYSQALEHANDPERFLQELQIAGYATDPNYAEKAVSIMRQIERDTLPL